MTKHAIIPDVQAKDGCDTNYLYTVGSYLVEKKPDVWVCLGDFADMPSLSMYDIGKKQFEGRRYRKDLDYAQDAMRKLMSPLLKFNEKARRNKEKQYHPRLVLTLGNHENRIIRVIESDPKLDGTMCISDLGFEAFGWEVYPYLEVVEIDGVCYSHYFTSGVLGRPVTSARALVQKKHTSCVMGHVQNMEIHTEYKGNGKRITGLFAGTCYTHNEDYLGQQGNNYFRGIHMLYDVKDGEFNCHSLTLDYLLEREAKKRGLL